MRRHEPGRRARGATPPATQPVRAGNATQRSDVELLCAVADGDRAAFGELYDRLAQAALSLSTRIVGSRRDAEDVVHDVFLECWRDAAAYDPSRASVRTWLLMRTRSRSLDRLRSARRIATTPVEDAIEARRGARVNEITAGGELGVVHQLLRRLSSEQRVVLELGYFGGCTSAEIAVALEIPIGTVKSRMMRALDKLRTMFERE